MHPRVSELDTRTRICMHLPESVTANSGPPTQDPSKPCGIRPFSQVHVVSASQIWTTTALSSVRVSIDFELRGYVACHVGRVARSLLYCVLHVATRG